MFTVNTSKANIKKKSVLSDQTYLYTINTKVRWIDKSKNLNNSTDISEFFNKSIMYWYKKHPKTECPFTFICSLSKDQPPDICKHR